MYRPKPVYRSSKLAANPDEHSAVQGSQRAFRRPADRQECGPIRSAVPRSGWMLSTRRRRSCSCASRGSIFTRCAARRYSIHVSGPWGITFGSQDGKALHVGLPLGCKAAPQRLQCGCDRKLPAPWFRRDLTFTCHETTEPRSSRCRSFSCRINAPAQCVPRDPRGAPCDCRFPRRRAG